MDEVAADHGSARNPPQRPPNHRRDDAISEPLALRMQLAAVPADVAQLNISLVGHRPWAKKERSTPKMAKSRSEAIMADISLRQGDTVSCIVRNHLVGRLPYVEQLQGSNGSVKSASDRSRRRESETRARQAT